MTWRPPLTAHPRPVRALPTPAGQAAGPQGGTAISRAEHRIGTYEVIASVRLAGEQEAKVRAVADSASPTGSGYLAIRVGRVLVYLEDRAALDALSRAVREAAGHADAVYGRARDAFSLAEARARRDFEQGRRPRP